MLVGVAHIPPSLISTLRNILHYKKAKLRKHLQHSVFTIHFCETYKIESSLNDIIDSPHGTYIQNFMPEILC